MITELQVISTLKSLLPVALCKNSLPFSHRHVAKMRLLPSPFFLPWRNVNVYYGQLDNRANGTHLALLRDVFVSIALQKGSHYCLSVATGSMLTRHDITSYVNGSC